MNNKLQYMNLYVGYATIMNKIEYVVYKLNFNFHC